MLHPQVTAKNDNLESNLSNYATLKFDPLAYVEPVEKLIVVNKTENSITLSWKPVNNVDGYRIKPSIPFELFYPKLPVVNVSNNTTFVTSKYRFLLAHVFIMH